MRIHLGIVVRSLADSIGVDQVTRPYRMDSQFLAFIKSKADNRQQEICDVVNNYHCAWWRRNLDPGVPMLCSQTVDECLKVHRNEQHKAGVFRHLVHRPIPPPVGVPPPSEPPAQDPFRCRTCILYRHALADAQAGIMQVTNFASAQRDTAKSKADLARRAMAAAHCFREVYMAKASAAAKAGDPLPLDMTEDEISKLVPIATQSIQSNGTQISPVPPPVSHICRGRYHCWARYARIPIHAGPPQFGCFSASTDHG